MSNLEAIELNELSSIFAALGDVTRLRLVTRLGEGQKQSIAQLAAGLGLSHQGISKHLQVLERSGLVIAEKVGRERHYLSQPEKIAQANDYLQDLGSAWDDALTRLQQFVEED